MIVVLSYRMDPEERLLFELDWSGVLHATSDTIASSTWSTDSQATIDSPDVAGGTIASIWVSAVPEGSECQIVNRVVTAAGRIFRRGIVVFAA